MLDNRLAPAVCCASAVCLKTTNARRYRPSVPGRVAHEPRRPAGSVRYVPQGRCGRREALRGGERPLRELFGGGRGLDVLDRHDGAAELDVELRESGQASENGAGAGTKLRRM